MAATTGDQIAEPGTGKERYGVSRSCVVVGAGIIGTCVALRMAREGVQVTLVDASAPGQGTTSTTGAWVNANAKRPYAYFRLNCAGIGAHRRLAAEFESAPWFLPTGNLEWAASGDEESRLDGRVQELRDWGYPSAWLAPEQVMCHLEPELVIPPDVRGVVFFSDEILVYPQLLLAHALRALRALGVRFSFGCRVEQIETSSERATGVRLENGERIAADMIVSCAGRWTPELLSPLGVRVPLVSPEDAESAAVGLLVSTTGLAVDLRRMVHAGGLSMRPDGAGRLQLHGDAEDREVRWNASTTPSAPAWRLVEQARRLVRHGEGLGVHAAVIGIRSLPIDGLPVVGWAPGLTGLYVVVTHSGVTLGPLLGELVALEASGREQTLLTSFRPDRFLTA